MAKKDGLVMGLHNFGLPSLLVVFLVLSLLTFAVLSLSTAKGDYNLALQLSEHRQDFYEACSKAETILWELNKLPDIPAQLDGIILTASQNTVHYAIPVGELQELIISAKKTADGWLFTDYHLHTIAPEAEEPTLALISVA